MNIRRTALIVALSTFATIGFAQISSTTQGSNGQQGSSMDANGASNGNSTGKHASKHHKHKKSGAQSGSDTTTGAATPNDSMLDNGASPNASSPITPNNGSAPNSTTLPSTTTPNGSVTPNSGGVTGTTPPRM